MQSWASAVENVQRILYSMKISDMAEIMIIAFLIYELIMWILNTRAWYLLRGVLVILGFLLIAVFFEMNTILWIAANVAPVAATAVIVILQPELRKALEELGKKNVLTTVLPFENVRKIEESISARSINEIAKACVEMGKARTGALIVIQNKDNLADYERTGIDVDGIVTSQLLINIFEHNTPLHDGAVIVRGNRITSATCYLPLSDNMNLGKELGTRHRAGVGISEVTDSLTVIVSEETGNISVANAGKLDKVQNAEQLKEILGILRDSDEEDDKGKRKRKGRSKERK